MNKQKNIISGKNNKGPKSNGNTTPDSYDDDRERVVKSFCRLRPFDGVNNSFFRQEDPKSNGEILSVNKANIQNSLIEDLGDKFHFDKIFDDDYTQIEIFQETCIDLVLNLIEKRKSSLLLAHGLNDSGKTYTIVGNTGNPGMLPLSLRFIYDKLHEKKDTTTQIYCNYVEFFDNSVYDLLSGPKRRAGIISNNSKCNQIKDVNNYKLENIQDFSNALNLGNKMKKMDRGTSQSHTLFKIILRFPDQDEDLYEECSISIIDLAMPSDKEFININDEEIFKNICLDVNKQDLYFMHYSLVKFVRLCEKQKALPIITKKSQEKKLRMDFCNLLKYLRYYFYGNEDIVLITAIKPSLGSTEENVKVLDFTKKLVSAITYIDKETPGLKTSKICLISKNSPEICEKILPDIKILTENKGKDESDTKKITEKSKEEKIKEEKIKEVSISQCFQENYKKQTLSSTDFQKEEKEESLKISTSTSINQNSKNLNLISDESYEKMKQDYQELIKRFDEQQKVLRNIIEKDKNGNAQIQTEKNRLPGVHNLVSSTLVEVNDKLKDLDLKKMTQGSKLFNIILINPSIDKLSLSNHVCSQTCTKEEKIDLAPKMKIEAEEEKIEEIKKIEKKEKIIEEVSDNESTEVIFNLKRKKESPIKIDKKKKKSKLPSKKKF